MEMVDCCRYWSLALAFSLADYGSGLMSSQQATAKSMGEE